MHVYCLSLLLSLRLSLRFSLRLTPYIPEHLVHINVPLLTLAQVGSDAEQSAQFSLPGSAAWRSSLSSSDEVDAEDEEDEEDEVDAAEDEEDDIL